jgi:hypothetical protein
VVVFRCVDYDRGGWERKPYLSERLNVRRRDFHAVDSCEPFRVRATWGQLDDGL